MIEIHRFAMISRMRRRILRAAIVWPSLARAHSFSLGDIAIGHAWALPVKQGDGQVSTPLINNGKQPDELISARSAICAQIELRQNNRYDEPPLKSFVLNPGRPLSMRPAARHLRLIGLRQNLKVNDQFPLLLDFLRAGEIEITVLIEKQPGS
jgi:hypothetical protein